VKKKKLSILLAIVLTIVMMASIFPATAFSMQTYYFLNPLGTITPRQDIPLACRSSVTDILEAEGSRELRLGVSWFRKSLDGDVALALAEMLRDYWHSASANPARTDIPAGLTVRLVYPPPPENVPIAGVTGPMRPGVPGQDFVTQTTIQVTPETHGCCHIDVDHTGIATPAFDTYAAFGRPYYHFIPNIGFPWNPRADHVYDQWAERADAMIMGVGD